eukprot:TRINITY_DN36632_c0_g1_i1.p1 TRINITY_DN36632_c0_g1~~TRINITY_DN36632_c0_g1_i1.p1  ORF type:complete len:324 (+),score=92.10 TRINITY_DN36632_c0_g1_i1:52-1023(+)
MTDDDTSSSSEESDVEQELEEEEEEDYATQVARRVQEEKQWQNETHAEEQSAPKEIRVDPYEMLPTRFRVAEAETSEKVKAPIDEKNNKKTLLIAPTEQIEAPPEAKEPSGSESESDDVPDIETDDIPDINAFNPKVLADLIQADYEEPSDPNSDMFELATSVLEETIESDPHFDHLQQRFKAKYSQIFTDDEEQKLEYYTIFQSWVKKLDTYLTKKLSAVPSFNIEDYIQIMEERKDELSPDLWNLILSFTDYQVFKDAMLDHKENGPSTDSAEREELISVIEAGDKVMTKHINEAQRAREAQLAEEAVERGLEKYSMSIGV